MQAGKFEGKDIFLVGKRDFLYPFVGFAQVALLVEYFKVGAVLSLLKSNFLDPDRF